MFTITIKLRSPLIYNAVKQKYTTERRIKIRQLHRNAPKTTVIDQEAYFGVFYDHISAAAGAIDEDAREIYVQAYSRPKALHTGFEWYRASPQNEKDNRNAKTESVETPVLYFDSTVGCLLETYYNRSTRENIHDQ